MVIFTHDADSGRRAVRAAYYLYKKAYTPVVEKEPSGAEWRYLWLIPATFYLIWYYILYFNTSGFSLEVALRPGNVLFFFFINLGACLIYYVVTRLILAQEKNVELIKNNHRLTLSALQYENLQENIDRARRAKHDVRHHITLMQEYLKKHEYGELEKYLNSYGRSLPDDSLISFCENQAANSVLLYYAQQAKNSGIDYIVKTVIPGDTGIAENDLAVLLGNLLENALYACAAEKDDNKKIVIRAETDETSLYITVDNTMTGTVRVNGDGKYYSAKHDGLGIGTQSVKHIADKYNGLYKSEQKDGMFMTSVCLKK